MRLSNVSAGLTALIVLLVMDSCTSKKSADESPAAATTQPALPVDIILAQETSQLQTETVTGSLLPFSAVDIVSEVSKKINAVLFKEGSLVGKGQILYKLDDADILARIRQLQSELNLASLIEARLKQLLQAESVRQEEYDIASSKLQSLQAGYDLLKIELSKTAIRAPFTGHIGITKVFAGSYVSPGMIMTSLQNQSLLKIQFTLPEKLSQTLKNGDQIKFTTELNNVMYTAAVATIEPSIEASNRNLTVQAVYNNKSGLLKPGMSVKVYFHPANNNSKGILIPTEALIPGNGSYQVFLVKKNTARLTPVTILTRTDKEAFITNGIKQGDTVMISNLLRATDGTPVQVIKP
ncbi:MAG: efflux RND transporter periplasmic adaptor subunit [Chitinophagaceae bacterium]|nr:efflux RND transporter periplasmic adaptor subunit [Chitinophagaceae bacterium]